MMGYFLLPPSQPTAKGGKKGQGQRKPWAVISARLTEVIPIRFGPDSAPGFQKRDFILMRNRITTAAGQKALNTPCLPPNRTDSPPHTDTFLEYPEKMPKQSLHSPRNTWGLWWSNSSDMLSLAFPGCYCPGRPMHPSATHRALPGKKLQAREQGRGAHPARGQGVPGTEPSHPGLPRVPSLSPGACGACLAWGAQGAKNA